MFVFLFSSTGKSSQPFSPICSFWWLRVISFHVVFWGLEFGARCLPLQIHSPHLTSFPLLLVKMVLFTSLNLFLPYWWAALLASFNISSHFSSFYYFCLLLFCPFMWWRLFSPGPTFSGSPLPAFLWELTPGWVWPCTFPAPLNTCHYAWPASRTQLWGVSQAISMKSKEKPPKPILKL